MLNLPKFDRCDFTLNFDVSLIFTKPTHCPYTAVHGCIMFSQAITRKLIETSTKEITKHDIMADIKNNVDTKLVLTNTKPACMTYDGPLSLKSQKSVWFQCNVCTAHPEGFGACLMVSYITHGLLKLKCHK